MSSTLELRPEQVLDEQAKLRDRFSYPNDDLLWWLQGFAASKANRARWELMFYPHGPADGGLESRRFAGAIGRDLFAGRAYQVIPEMVKVLKGVFTETLKGTEHIEAAELPSGSGFIWYDTPLELTERTGGTVTIRAISWGPQPVYIKRRDAFGRPGDPVISDGVRIIFWSRAGDPGDYPDVLLSQVDTLGDLQINHCMVFPFGERFPDQVRPGQTGTSALHWIHVTWMLLGAEIAAHRRSPLGRHAQRRLARSLKHGEVTVITLRRAAAARELEPGHREVDWTCRWLVQGFWRHIEEYDLAAYHHHRPASDGDAREPRCTACRAKVTWVRPHVRGPEDKPLKQTRQLYRLSQ
jgi:hypothetical protein